MLRPPGRALRGAALPLAGLSLLALAACGSGDASSSSQAASGTASAGTETSLDESALVVYSGRQEQLVAPLFDMFTEETGIEVSVRYADSATLAAQLLEEGDRSPADAFFSQDAGALGALQDAEALAPLPEETVTQVEERFRSDAGEWVGVSGRARVIAYDPQQVPEGEVPTSVFDVADERWAGEVGVAPTNASFQSFVTAVRVLEGEDRARELLQGLVDNDVQTFANNIAVLDAVDSGEVSLGLINHYYLFERLAEEGDDAVNAEIAFLPADDPGALVNVAGVGVLASSDRAEDAERFASFLLSEEAQRYLAEETKEYPLAAGVQPSEGLPPLAEVQGPDIDLSDLDTLDETLALLEEVGLT